MKHIPASVLMFLVLLVLALFTMQPSAVSGAGTMYFVSSSGGSDSNDGLSQGAPFRTIARVNSLALLPGDQVLFKCGDIWRGEMLRITSSGSASNPITFSSYPAGCANQPVFSGAQPITGWTQYSGEHLRCGPVRRRERCRTFHQVRLPGSTNCSATASVWALADGPTRMPPTAGTRPSLRSPVPIKLPSPG